MIPRSGAKETWRIARSASHPVSSLKDFFDTLGTKIFAVFAHTLAQFAHSSSHQAKQQNIRPFATLFLKTALTEPPTKVNIWRYRDSGLADDAVNARDPHHRAEHGMVSASAVAAT